MLVFLFRQVCLRAWTQQCLTIDGVLLDHLPLAIRCPIGQVTSSQTGNDIISQKSMFQSVRECARPAGCLGTPLGSHWLRRKTIFWRMVIKEQGNLSLIKDALRQWNPVNSIQKLTKLTWFESSAQGLQLIRSSSKWFEVTRNALNFGS